MSQPSPPRKPSSSAPIVFEWLERIGLGYAVPHFKEKGIISPKALTSLNIKDYEDLHVSDLSDRKRLYELVQRVRLASRSVKQRSGAEEEERPTNTTPTAPPLLGVGVTTGSNGSSNTRSTNSTEKRSNEKAGRKSSENPSNGTSSAREVMRKQRAKERIRRLTKSPSKPQQQSEGNYSSSSNNSRDLSTPVTNNSRQSKKRSDSKDEEEAELAMASPLVPFVDNSESYDERYDKSGHYNEEGNNNTSSTTAFDILGIRKESFTDAKIRVVVRKRPLSRKEKAREDVDIVDMNDQSQVYLHEPRVKVDMTRYVETHEFAFDNAFDDKQDNSAIYKDTCRPLLCSVFDRHATATCFAYGQTGSGKTHTMMGPDKANDGSRTEKGLYERAAEDVFRLLKSKRYSHIGVHVSFFEIYGGRLYDLLNDRRKLRCLEDRLKQVQIVGLRSEKINNINDLFNLMNTGHAARSTGTTGANVDSSRSHAILQLKLIDTRTNKPTGGKFSFIDLAGSERGADTTHNNRQTRMEGAEINKSLLALKECIRALFHVQIHTPFRGSKLTQVLKDSFVGGNSHTVMVVTISPNLTNAEHTLNTLRYGYRVKEIKNEPGGKRRNRGLDLNRDYNSNNDPVRRSAPSFSSRDGHRMNNNHHSGGSGGRHSARVQHLQRPMTAGNGHRDSTPITDGNDGRSERGRSSRKSHNSRATPPNRSSVPSHPTSSFSNPPAPQAKSPNLNVPTSFDRRNNLPESTPSPDAIPVPVQRRSTSTKQREQQQQQQQQQQSEMDRDGVGSSKIPKLIPHINENIFSHAENSLSKNYRKKLRMTPTTTSTTTTDVSPSNAPTPPYGTTKTVDVDAGPLGIESLNGGSNNHNNIEEDEIIIQGMEEEHADLVTEIFTDEESLVAGHREQIHEMMNLVKEEMTALDEVEAPGSIIDDYVEKLEGILSKKMNIVSRLQNQLEAFKKKLEEEENLSASIGSSRNNSPAAKAHRGFDD